MRLVFFQKGDSDGVRFRSEILKIVEVDNERLRVSNEQGLIVDIPLEEHATRDGQVSWGVVGLTGVNLLAVDAKGENEL